MFRKFTPKVGKMSFQDVAKKEGLKGFATDKFKRQALESLHQGGMNKSDAQSILSGQRKVEQGTLKKVFKTLNKDKIIKKTPTAVTDYIKAEKGRQLRIYNTRMSLRAQEIKTEKQQEELKAEGKVPTKPKSLNQPGMSYESLGHVAKIEAATSNNFVQEEPEEDGNVQTTPPTSTEPNQEIKGMIEEAEKHDLPID